MGCVRSLQGGAHVMGRVSPLAIHANFAELVHARAIRESVYTFDKCACRATRTYNGGSTAELARVQQQVEVRQGRVFGCCASDPRG